MRDGGFVSTTHIGTSINPSMLGDNFRAILRDADVPRIQFQDLRHTNATMALLKNVHVKDVTKRSGTVRSA